MRKTIGALRGMTATQQRMLPALQGFNLLDQPLRPAVRTVIFQGRHDVGAPPSLAPVLAARVGADVIWFDASAHMPHEEEPRRFCEELLRFYGSLGVLPAIQPEGSSPSRAPLRRESRPEPRNISCRRA